MGAARCISQHGRILRRGVCALSRDGGARGVSGRDVSALGGCDCGGCVAAVLDRVSLRSRGAAGVVCLVGGFRAVAGVFRRFCAPRERRGGLACASSGPSGSLPGGILSRCRSGITTFPKRALTRLAPTVAERGGRCVSAARFSCCGGHFSLVLCASGASWRAWLCEFGALVEAPGGIFEQWPSGITTFPKHALTPACCYSRSLPEGVLSRRPSGITTFPKRALTPACSPARTRSAT